MNREVEIVTGVRIRMKQVARLQVTRICFSPRLHAQVPNHSESASAFVLDLEEFSATGEIKIIEQYTTILPYYKDIFTNRPWI